jgi:hypothetical protein
MDIGFWFSVFGLHDLIVLLINDFRIVSVVSGATHESGSKCCTKGSVDTNRKLCEG